MQLVESRSVVVPTPLGQAHRPSLKPAARKGATGNPFKRDEGLPNGRHRGLPSLAEDDHDIANQQDELPAEDAGGDMMDGA